MNYPKVLPAIISLLKNNRCFLLQHLIIFLIFFLWVPVYLFIIVLTFQLFAIPENNFSIWFVAILMFYIWLVLATVLLRRSKGSKLLVIFNILVSSLLIWAIILWQAPPT